jgi:glucan 1,3-beta-glucosidase
MKLKGVNLGGWLVLEKWITPSLFEGLHAQDETSFCLELGDKKEAKLQEHWKTWITADDFAWVAASGLNAVRIPVGHWIFGDVEPYVGSLKYLDWAMKQAEAHGLKVVIDVHTAPGSQNGHDHSGFMGDIRWHTDPQNRAQSIAVLQKLTERYADSNALYGIELLNEPSQEIPKKYLLEYYEHGYEVVRHQADEGVTVIISDAFQPKKWRRTLSGRKYKNTALDLHLYQCFGAHDKSLSLAEHIRKAEKDWHKLIRTVQKHKPAIIGEWSLALDGSTYHGLSASEAAEGKRAYGNAQLQSFEEAAVWFYWSYKTETATDWSFRHLVEKDVLSF